MESVAQFCKFYFNISINSEGSKDHIIFFNQISDVKLKK